MVEFEEQVLMRVFMSENDRYERKPVYDVLLDFFREEGFSGATVLKAAAGFGSRSKIHTDHMLRLAGSDLPVVVEVVGEQGKFETLLPRIEEMCVHGGLVTFENVRVVRLGK